MSVITAYARARAVAAGVAQPIATVRHVHLAERPLVFVPLTLAGEANAPLAAMIGTDAEKPTLLTVPQPRNRDLRFAFAARLADIVVPYVDSFSHEVEPLRDTVCAVDAPQLIVPNPMGIEFTRLLGRSTRFRRTDGPYAVAPGVPLLGRWLTYFAERAEHPGSCALLALTDALSLHWATGQSALEDTNLAALMAWIDPPAESSGAQAAREAENPKVWPPAGPATDPEFDNQVLAPLIRAYDTSAPDSPARQRALDELEQALASQLEPTWHLMWRGIAHLRSLPPGVSVAGRWAADRRAFTDFHRYVSEGGAPQPRRDGAVAAAYRLNLLERARTTYEAERAFDDPLVMATHRLTGEAFQGTVVSVDRERRVPNEKGNLVTRPLVTVHTKDPVRLPAGAKVAAATRRSQTGLIVSVETVPDGTLVTLELSGGMGRAKVPPPGSVPALDEQLCYSGVLPENIPSPALPPVEETPWTHGGPPQPYEPSDEDAAEVWE